MGTSKDYGAPRTPDWGNVKRDVTRGGGNPEPIPPPHIPEPLVPDQIPQQVPPPPDIRRPLARMANTLSGFISAQYGGGTSSGSGGGTPGNRATGNTARRSAQRVGRNLGGFFADVRDAGFQAAAERLGLGTLQGMSTKDIAMALTDRLVGPATTIDDVDARSALSRLMNETLKDLSPDEVVQALERIPTGNEFTRFMERFFAYYIFEQFNRIFYSRLVARVGEANAEHYLKNGQHCIEWMLRSHTERSDLASVDWQGPQGETVVNNIMESVFRIFTGGDQ